MVGAAVADVLKQLVLVTRRHSECAVLDLRIVYGCPHRTSLVRVLIVDGHAGPMNDAQTFLTKLMHAEVETISYLMYSAHAQRQSHRLLSSTTRA